MDAAATFGDNPASASSWSSMTSMSPTNILGLSFFGSLLSNHVWMDSLKLLVLGTIIETGRRLCQWLIERFSLQLCVTARFDEGDPTYEWIILFLTQEKIWRRSKDFAVASKSSKRKWGVDPESEIGTQGNADYIPTYQLPQLFRWNGYWVEVKRTSNTSYSSGGGGGRSGSTSSNVIYISMYTLRMGALSELVEEARSRYTDASRPNVTVHMADSPSYGPDMIWTNVKQKSRRPMNSVILPDGVVDSLVKDALEFIETEDWYVEAGIPHRRGYLLHGPPGTGKTSTIYALAGELGLEIYTLSLSSTFIDDTFLTKAASSIPKKSIFLIEDIDCAFPAPREDDDDDHNDHFGMMMPRKMVRKSSVTLSGLLNVLDGVGSEEGKLFFATTNHPDRLDPALTRPGRIDMKIEYFLSTQDQAAALFMRFFNRAGAVKPAPSSPTDEKPAEPLDVPALSTTFASSIPEHKFSTAELQGFLLTCKRQPLQAVQRIKEWADNELYQREEKERRKEEKRRKKEEEKNNGQASPAMRGGYGMGPYGGMVMPYGGGMVKPAETKEPLTPVPAYSAPASGSSSPAVKTKDVKEDVEAVGEKEVLGAGVGEVVAVA